MTTKTIPAQTIKVCDCCDVIMNRENSRQDGGLILKADVLDMHGHAVASETRKLDLCDSCLHDMEKGIGAVLRSKAEQRKANEGATK